MVYMMKNNGNKEMTNEEVVKTLVQSLIRRQERQGWDGDAARTYTLGYMESTLAMVLNQLPKKKQKELVQEFSQRIFKLAAE